MKNLILFLLLIGFFGATAQQRKTQGQVGSANDVVGGFFRKNSQLIQGKEIEGSSYLMQNWQNQGEIYSKGKAIKLNNINLDLASDELSQRIENDSLFVFEKAGIDSVKINNRLLKPNKTGKMEEILSKGKKVTLLKQYEVDIIEGMFNPTDGTTKPARYKVIEDYFVIQNNIDKKISLSKKDLGQVFGKDKGLVETYIKENKLSYKDESDMIRAFNFYNTH